MKRKVKSVYAYLDGKDMYHVKYGTEYVATFENHAEAEAHCANLNYAYRTNAYYIEEEKTR